MLTSLIYFIQDSLLMSYLFQSHHHILVLPSFPTRRSSDLNGKPLYYFEGCSGTSINGVPVGQLIVVNCTNFQASNLRIDSVVRSEEHTSELQSLTNIVCRLLLEKKKVNEVYSS